MCFVFFHKFWVWYKEVCKSYKGIVNLLYFLLLPGGAVFKMYSFCIDFVSHGPSWTPSTFGWKRTFYRKVIRVLSKTFAVLTWPLRWRICYHIMHTSSTMCFKFFHLSWVCYNKFCKSYMRNCDWNCDMCCIFCYHQEAMFSKFTIFA